MGQNINYGTSLLKTSVAFASGVTELEDNNAAIQQARTGATEENNKFEATAGQFTLTGILVGGQTKTVGWDYTSKDGSFNYVVYDKDIVSAAVPTPANEETYTLVWDNYTTGSTQNFVYVALEFTNNGGDFMGADGVIPAGGTFYLTATLDPATATNKSTVTHNTVFKQDYNTVATFTIGNGTTGGSGGLATATNGIPDLRTPKVELGLSVNLQWQPGLVFNKTF